MCVSVWGWPKGRSPNSCVLVPVSRHLVHSTRNAGIQGREWCPSPPLKSSVHPSIPSHCPQGSRRPQLNTDLPERAQVQQGVCPTAKSCACFLWAYERVVQLSFSLLERLKKLQMQVFDQPAECRYNRKRESVRLKCIKKIENIETTERNNSDEDFAGLK